MKQPELFSKVPRGRLYQRVAKQIQGLIIAGEIRIGDKLPSEAELCEQFGVSRTVIREATKALAERGLLVSEPRRGTLVTALSRQDLADSFGLYVKASEVSARNLIEVRELLEVKIAELAAERAKPENLVKMEQALEELEKSIGSDEEYISADLDFHMALAEATQNEILAALIGSLVDELQYVRRASDAGSAGLLEKQRHRDQRHHKAIFECVKRQDKEGAVQGMQQHLQDTTRRYLAAQMGREKRQTS